MDVQDYCKRMEAKMTVWKAKLYIGMRDLKKSLYFRFSMVVVLLSLVALIQGCGTGNDGGNQEGEFNPFFESWRQYQSGSAGEGVLAVNTQFAVPSLLKWEVEVGRVEYGSPVVGPDGSVYVGNLQGELVAISPEGQERWRRTFFNGSRILSTPAVAADGSIFVVTTHRLLPEDDFVSKLNRIAPDGTWLWNRPALQEGRKTTSSPRIYGDHVFLYVPAAVAVYDFDGNLVSQGRAGDCTPICGGGPIDFGALFRTIGETLLDCAGVVLDPVECFENFIVEFDTTGDLFPPPDPTVAIVDSPNVVGGGGPVVVALNSYCMTGFRFEDEELEPLWTREVYGGDCGDEGVNHGSPAIIPGGLLVIANEKGQVTGHDPLTGAELWEYRAEDASFLSTPASYVRPIIVSSKGRVHILEANGTLITTRELLGVTQASVALSASHAYLATSSGLFTYELDFDPSSHFTVDGSGLNRMSSVAIGDDGTVYAVTSDGMLRAYGAELGTIK